MSDKLGDEVERDVSRTQYLLELGLILAMIGFGIVIFYVVIQHGF